jgi:exopolyphosphatase/guanosine-5'-triphosphate,3'-diphosphate pyrophosphatase
LERKTAITKLGEGVDRTRSLGESGMARTLEVLKNYAFRMNDLGVEKRVAIATSACRDAENRDVFFREVERVVGCRPVLLSGGEEAALSFVGALLGRVGGTEFGGRADGEKAHRANGGGGAGGYMAYNAEAGGDKSHGAQGNQTDGNQAERRAESKSRHIDLRNRTVLVVDIGGGSTELTVGRIETARTSSTSERQSESRVASSYESKPGGNRGKAGRYEEHRRPESIFTSLGVAEASVSLEGWASLDVGCVRLTEMFLSGDPPGAEQLSEAFRYVDSLLVEAERSVPVTEAEVMVGLAGTITSLAAIDLQLDRYDPEAVHHHVLGRQKVEEIFRYLASATKEEIRQEPALEKDRADVILGGTVVLAGMLRRWGLDSVVVSEADILDGAAMACASGALGAL